MVLKKRRGRRLTADSRSVGRHLRKVQGLHQAVHSSDTDMDAIITLKNISDFVCAKPFSMLTMDAKDQRRKLLILRDTGRWSRMKVLIISTSIDAQHPA